MKNRWLATLALATACAAPLLVHAGTTKSEWKETLDCAVSTNLTAFDASAAGCWTAEKKGTINTFGEYHEFSSDRQFIIISLYLAEHNTVWRKNDPNAALTAATGFLEDQDAVLNRSKERTVPVSLWVRRAGSYDLKTNSYGNGCFAFVSTGGSKGGSSSYLLGAIASNRDGSPMTLEQRQTISQSIRIKHPKRRRAIRSEFLHHCMSGTGFALS